MQSTCMSSLFESRPLRSKTYVATQQKKDDQVRYTVYIMAFSPLVQWTVCVKEIFVDVFREYQYAQGIMYIVFLWIIGSENVRVQQGTDKLRTSAELLVCTYLLDFFFSLLFAIQYLQSSKDSNLFTKYFTMAHFKSNVDF